jgi:hypothetical protein
MAPAGTTRRAKRCGIGIESRDAVADGFICYWLAGGVGGQYEKCSFFFRKKHMRCLFSALGVVLALGTPAWAQAKKEPLVLQVKNSIDRGVHFLKGIQRPDGRWPENIQPYEGGITSLALLALLYSGVAADDPGVKRGLDYLRGLEPGTTYVRALQTMVFVEAGQVVDRQRIRDNVKWLIDTRVFKDGQFIGWGYSKGLQSGVTDNSNTQYAMLGLWAGRQAGLEIDQGVWKSVRDYYLATQDPRSGGWAYQSHGIILAGGGPSLTMTTAGLSGLLIAGMELGVGREKLQPDGTAAGCGMYEENKATAQALNWIGNHFALDSSALTSRTYYNLYGLERTGRLTGQRFLGGHDWYREGCKFLVNEQTRDGSWVGAQPWEMNAAVSTSFALLFLSKGRTPVLISKLAHGPPLRRDIDTDWNNDRNDLRHLVDYSAKELFNKLPLAWQTFDILRAATPKGDSVTEEDELEATGDLLQSPIVYFNGHTSPQQRFTAVEKKILRRYIDNGGFILAEACCGSADFDRGFRRLVEELWPDNELTELDGEHPVWKSFFPVKPGDPYKLWGMSLGCKTVLIYSPQDLSCQWESNNTKSGKGLKAFQLGANIVAYATGREPPKPRLTEVDVSRDRDPRVVPRGYMKVAQIRHRGDWQPAPKAMRNLMDKMSKVAGLDVVLKTEELPVDNPSIVDFKFLYMHGRRDFHFSDEELKYLRFNLENGGLLFADACCGKEAFDKAFRAFAKQLFPKEKLVQVPPDDVLFKKELSGEDLTAANIQSRREVGGPMRQALPYLEGIKLNGRWVLLYSKYDIGCALERHQSVDCLGYDPASAFKIAGAAVLYSMRP